MLLNNKFNKFRLSNMITFQDYEAAIALNEERHFARAARRLNVSQPALTSRLRRLEEDVGCRLFDRSRSGVSPTSAGLAFCEGAQRVQDASTETLAAVRAAEDGFGLTLRIGMTQLATHSAVVPALTRFRKAHPRARLRLVEGTTWSLERDLEQSLIDIAFLHPPLHAPGLSQRVLCDAGVILIAASQASLSRKPVRYPRNEAPVLMGQIERHHLVASLPDTDDPPVEANSALTALTLSAAGYGPAFITDDFPSCDFEFEVMSNDEPVTRLETSIAWRTLDRRTALRAFLDVATDAAT